MSLLSLISSFCQTVTFAEGFIGLLHKRILKMLHFYINWKTWAFRNVRNVIFAVKITVHKIARTIIFISPIVYICRVFSWRTSGRRIRTMSFTTTCWHFCTVCKSFMQ